MKKLLIHFLTIFGTLVCMPTLLAQQDIKLFSMLNPLPLEMKIEVLKNYSCLELIKLYDALMAIKREIPGNIARDNNRFKEAFLEEAIDAETGVPFKRFKGDNLLEALQVAAGDKVSKLVGCSVTSMQDGTCQPLKDSTDSTLTPEQKTARPFAETTGEWTKNWVRLLPVVEAMNDLQKHMTGFAPLWKTNFLKVMHDINTHPEDYIRDFSLPGQWHKLISPDEKAFQKWGDYRYYDFMMSCTYLSLLPEALQNAAIKKIKEAKNNYNKLDLSAKVDPYGEYNKEIFFAKIRALKLPKMIFWDMDNGPKTDLSAPKTKKWWQVWRK